MFVAGIAPKKEAKRGGRVYFRIREWSPILKIARAVPALPAPSLQEGGRDQFTLNMSFWAGRYPVYNQTLMLLQTWLRGGL
jgi:hypothetical protein